MVSHRSGETEDTFISDLVVGLSTGQIKSGLYTHTYTHAYIFFPLLFLNTNISWAMLFRSAMSLRESGQIQPGTTLKRKVSMYNQIVANDRILWEAKYIFFSLLQMPCHPSLSLFSLSLSLSCLSLCIVSLSSLSLSLSLSLLCGSLSLADTTVHECYAADSDRGRACRRRYLCWK